MSSRLYLYVMNPESRQEKILDADNLPDSEGTWTLGRSKDRDIQIRDSWVSSIHAIIRATPMEGPKNKDKDGNQKYVWAIQDQKSTNGTRLDGTIIGNEDWPSCPWIQITEHNILTLGRVEVLCSFFKHDTDRGGTLGGGEESEPTDPGGEQSEVPTNIPAAKPAPTEPKSTTMWEFFRVVLNGPKGFPDQLWWVMLFAGGLLVAYWWLN